MSNTSTVHLSLSPLSLHWYFLILPAFSKESLGILFIHRSDYFPRSVHLSTTENWCRTHQYWEFDSEFATRSTEDVDSVSISQQSVSSLKKVMEKIELVSLWWGWPHTAGVFTASHYSRGVYKNNRLDVHQLTNTLRRVP